MYQLLNANCVINGAFNVQAVHMAASDHTHVAHLYPSRLARNNFGSLGINADWSVSTRGEPCEAVDAGCVDDLVARHCQGRRIAFIKLDVQAYEKYALLGLMRTVTKDRPKILFEVAPYWMQRAGYDYREIYELLRHLDYNFEHFIPLPLTSAGVPDVPLDDRAEWDTLAVATR
jgi:FkbM family methyltransferase